jgi:hypothetical protein
VTFGERKHPMKRTGFKNRGQGLDRTTSKPLKPGKRLRPMSDKKRAEIPERAAVKEAVFERDSYQCRIAPFLPDIECGGELDAHEPQSRARGGDPLDVDQCVTACRRHHDWVHEHPAAAAALGLLQHSWQEREEPV